MLLAVGDDEPDARHPAQLVGGAAGEAPGHDDPRIGVFPGRPLNEPADVPVRAAGQSAGIDEDVIAAPGILFEPEPALPELLGPSEGFGLVDPAAEVPDGERGHIFSWSFFELASTFSAIFFRWAIKLFPEAGVLDGQDLDGQQGGVRPARLPQGHRGHRNALGHLDGREKGVHARQAALSTGTPMTGRTVWAATTPARWAALPATAMKTSVPRSSASRTSCRSARANGGPRSPRA